MDIFGENIRKIFKQYDEVKDKVDIFRKDAKNKRESRTGNLENEKSEKKVNNENIYNIVSILGGRGTGKTSILIQLAEDLNKEEKDNIVFPLIEPERISNDDDLLGWVIKLILDEGQKIIKDLDKEIDINSNICGLRKERGTIESLINNVKKSYFIRKDSYNEIISREYGNKSDYIKETNTRLNAIVELQGSFRKLIDEIVNYKSKGNSNPMLIFMFDDVDICAPLVSKILNLIMNYLSHPNIVTYIAGDYQSFQESISIEFLKSENLLHEDLLHKEVLDDGISIVQRRVDRSYDFLKKVMPSQHRYYINPLSNEKKFDLIFNQLYLVNQNNNKVKETLKDIFSKISIATSKNNKENNERLEFIKHNNEILYDYMCIFDDNLRGMIHVIDFINNNIKKISSKDKEEKLNFINSLLEKIIDSKLSFRDKKKFILKVINIPNRINDTDGFTGYINYSMIVEKLYEKESDNRSRLRKRSVLSGKYLTVDEVAIIKEKDFKLYYDLFILSSFFEILIVILNIREENTQLHGSKELVSMLNLLNSSKDDFKLFPIIEQREPIIAFKQELFKKMEYNQIRSLFNKNMGYLEAIYIDSIVKLKNNKLYKNNENISYVFEEVFDYDSRWVKAVLNYIKGNIKTRENMFNTICNNLVSKFKYMYKLVDKDEIKSLYDNGTNDLKKLFRKEDMKRIGSISETTITDIFNIIDRKKYVNNINTLDNNDRNTIRYVNLIGQKYDLEENMKVEEENISLEYLSNVVIYKRLYKEMYTDNYDYLWKIEMTIDSFYHEYEDVMNVVQKNLNEVRNYFESKARLIKSQQGVKNIIDIINYMEYTGVNSDELDQVIKNLERYFEVNSQHASQKDIEYGKRLIRKLKDSKNELRSNKFKEKKKIVISALRKLLPTYFEVSMSIYEKESVGKTITDILCKIDNEINEYKNKNKKEVKTFKIYLNEEYKDA